MALVIISLLFISSLYTVYKIIDYISFLFWYHGLNPERFNIFHWISEEIPPGYRRFTIINKAINISEISTQHDRLFISTYYIYKNSTTT